MAKNISIDEVIKERKAADAKIAIAIEALLTERAELIAYRNPRLAEIDSELKELGYSLRGRPRKQSQSTAEDNGSSKSPRKKKAKAAKE